VIEAAGTMTTRDLDDRAALLGLPFAGLGSVPPWKEGAFGLPVNGVRVDGRVDEHVPEPVRPPADGPKDGPNGGARGVRRTAVPLERVRVLDLSSLWAGPLCGQLLAAAGAEVVKVESTLRPDGARRGTPAFFDLLNGAKRAVALDLSAVSGRRDLRHLIEASDVIIESTRPRALEQMGIVATDVLDLPAGPRVWASITSHGRGRGRRERVAFGDGAAVAGGLVASDDAGPCFLADAVADPLAGLVTAAAVLEALCAGGRWLIDAAMAPMTASVSGPLLDVRSERPAPPRARDVTQKAPAFGADTDAVLGTLAR
jgi:hypothetical protein